MSSKISARQAGLISCLLVMSNKMLLLPSHLYETVKADGIFIMLALFIFDFASLFIFIKLKRTYPNQKLLEILKDKIGTIGAKIIFIIMLVFFFFKIILTFSIGYLYFQQQVYQDEFLNIAIVSIFPLACFTVVKGLRPLARTIEVCYALMIGGALICISLALFTPLSLPIFFVSSVKEISLTAYKNIFAFGDFLFLFLIIDKVDMSKKQEKNLLFHAFLGMFVIIFLYSIFYAKYPVTAFMHNNALSDVVVFSVEFNAFGRLDVIAMVIICFIAIFQFSLFWYAFCDCLTNIFPKMTNKYSIVVLTVAFFVMYQFFLGKYEVLVEWANGWQAILGLIITFLLPLIFFILSFKRRKNEKDIQKSS